MNVAIIIAGGVGSRMGQNIPKQFIEVDGRTVLSYTLEGFQNHPLVDAIEVVCIKGWEDVVLKDTEKYGFSKLRWITEGGDSGQESIRNGVFNLEDKCSPDDIVIIHDGIRPLVDREVLTDVINTAARFGNAVSSLPYNEQIFVVDGEDPSTTTRFIPRETLRRVATPQAYSFKLLDEKYHEAFETGVGIKGSHYTNTMMVELGVRLHFAAGSDKNIKLTTPDDLAIFKGYLARYK